VLQFLGRGAPLLGQRRGAAQVGARARRLGRAALRCPISPVVAARFLTWRTLRAGTASGLIEGDAGIGLVEIDQGLQPADVVGVVGADGEHGARHLRRDLHQIAADVGIVRRFDITRDRRQ
jgi:hypothetical protein